MSEFMPWNLSGTYYEVCNCEAISPCRRRGDEPGRSATHLTCDFALSWWIRDGRAGDVDLTGLKVVMTGRFVKQHTSPWSVMLYIDEAASPKQHDALVALFLGRAGGTTHENFAACIAEVLAVRTASVDLDHTPNQEKIDVMPYLTVRTKEPVPHEVTVTCATSGHDRPGQEVRAEIFRYADPPFDWEFRNKCGFATDFRYASE